MRIRAFKYLLPTLTYAGALGSFTGTGIEVWLPLLYAFVAIPLLELCLRPSAANLSTAEEAIAKADPLYDWLLYLIVPLQYAALYLFLQSLTDPQATATDLAGRTLVMGLLCGTFGINVGHELGHRVKPAEQTLARMLLLTSLYMHFFIEHNKGHHKRVATPDDPSSARYGEPLYLFYGRSIVQGIQSAWHIAVRDTAKKGYPAFSVHNELLRYLLLQAGFVTLVGWVWGNQGLLHFLGAAAMGILLLETVNYIEHYGLSRQPTGAGTWERTQPRHSWNSNHVIGRVMLFELSRHSDHHYLASRKYQVLRHHPDAPQMPTGYPGMMLLALVPPAWFAVMHPRIQTLQKSRGNNAAADMKGPNQAIFQKTNGNPG